MNYRTKLKRVLAKGYIRFFESFWIHTHMKHIKLTYFCNLCPLTFFDCNVFLGKGGVMKYQSVSNLSGCLWLLFCYGLHRKREKKEILIQVVIWSFTSRLGLNSITLSRFPSDAWKWLWDYLLKREI